MSDVRNKSKALLNSKLGALTSDSSCASNQAMALEAAVFEKHGQDTGNEYRSEIRHLSLDLGKNNVELGKQVASGSINAKEVVQMSNEQLKSTERAAQDSEIREQGLRESVGQDMMPDFESGGAQQDPTTAMDITRDPEESMGEEGDFKARGQPRIPGLEGVEFETTY